MKIKVGIPRALLYYYYYPLWCSFLQFLGAEVIPSAPTNKSILSRGLQRAGDDICLPVKLAFGHILALAPKVDCLFLPRLISVARREYICPKFLGFPDMVRQSLDGLPPVIDADIDLYRSGRSLWPAFLRAGRMLNSNRWRIYHAYRRALGVQKRYAALLTAGWLPEEAIAAVLGGRGNRPEQADKNKPVVAVIGHPYNIYDSYINMNLLPRLRAAGLKPVTADALAEETLWREVSVLPKQLFWTLSRRMVGAAFHYLRDPRVTGIIHITSFACGPDSMTGELIERRIRREGQMPFLNLTLDEHTGEAGLLTRLEAFLDMVQRRGRSFLPSIGGEEFVGEKETVLSALIPSAVGGR